jgi:hypothetical protein
VGSGVHMWGWQLPFGAVMTDKRCGGDSESGQVDSDEVEP